MSQAPFAERDRISLCMIVRNEELKLARALESARAWVGEIVVVDTGSTDRTVAIAESFGAKVVHFAWCDDFSAARNACLEAATREWALVLDADEEWVVDDPHELAKAVRQGVLDGFSFRYHNRLDDGSHGIGTVFRLFRRVVPGMRYRGELHEQVGAVSDGLVHTAAIAAAYIKHDGHTTAEMSKGKLERNIKLARKLVTSRPDDPFAWYALGLSLPLIDLQEMIAAYEKSLALLEAQGKTGSGEAYVVHMMHSLVAAYRIVRDEAKATARLEKALSVFPHSPDLRYERGELRLARQDFAGALVDFEVCLSPDAAAFYVIAEPGRAGYMARAGMAGAQLNLGRYDEAEANFRRAIAEAPATFVPPRRMLGMLHLQRGEWAEALPLLKDADTYAPGDAEVRFNLGWCLYKLERWDEAEEVLRSLADLPNAQHLLGKVLLEAGRGEQALPLLEACSLPAAGLARGWAYYVVGRNVAAADVWNEWLRAGAADWGTKDTLSMFLFLMQGGRRPSGEPERPAEPLRDMDQWFRLLLRHQRFDDVEAVIGRGPELGERLWVPLRKKWGITLAKEGYYDVALSLLLEACRKDGHDGELYYWLGYCSLHKQQVEDAKVMWEACLRYVPGHSLATQGLSLLR
jgi:tetratricopeptide (TPR) repeat protein